MLALWKSYLQRLSLMLPEWSPTVYCGKKHNRKFCSWRTKGRSTSKSEVKDVQRSKEDSITRNWRVSPRARPWKIDKTQKSIWTSRWHPGTLALYHILSVSDFRTVSIPDVFSAAGHPHSDPVRCTSLFLPSSCQVICSKAHEGVAPEPQPPTPNFKLTPQVSSPYICIVTFGHQAMLIMESTDLWVSSQESDRIHKGAGVLGFHRDLEQGSAEAEQSTVNNQPLISQRETKWFSMVGQRGPIGGATFSCFSPISNTGT